LWTLCSTNNRSTFALYSNKNISTFWINVALITKLNLAFFLGHPIYLYITVHWTQQECLTWKL
jgi:hypothetical protein